MHAILIVGALVLALALSKNAQAAASTKPPSGGASAAVPAAPAANLPGTSGGAVPSPPQPQITPTADLHTRNDFPASSSLGGFTGGNLSPVSVEPVVLDPSEQILNGALLRSHASGLVSAPQQNFGVTEPQSAAQTPENWSAGVSERIVVKGGPFTFQQISDVPAAGKAPAPAANPVPTVFRLFAPESAPATATLQRSEL